MRVVADTTVIVDVLRGDKAAVAFLEGLDAPPICSEITRIEVVRGLRSYERSPTEKLFSRLEFVDVDEATARRAGELGRRWRASHHSIGIADLAVAATAERLAAQLATANVKHFPMFSGLEPPY